MDVAGITSLNKVAKKSLLRNTLPHSKYFLIVSLLVDGMRDLNLFTVKGERIARIQMDAVNCISLPNDYLSFLKLGVPYNGRLHTFTLDESMITPMTIVDGIEVLDSTRGEGITRVDGKSNADGTRFVEGQSGYNNTGGKNEFYMKFDLPNRRIIIDGVSRTECTLMYKSNGVSATGGTLIPATYEESLLAWVDWKLSLGNKESAWSDRNEERYYQECNKVNFLESPSVKDLFDAIYSSWKQAVKR